jgi:cell division protein FtsA
MLTNTKTICTLNIGHSKVCCCVATADLLKDDPRIKVLSYFPISSKAFKNGVITNIEELTKDVGKAIQSSEEISEMKIDKIIVSFPVSMSSSGYTKASINLEGNVITENYIARLLTRSKNRIINDKEDIIHFLPVNYAIDGKDGVKDPIGQYGEKLNIDIHYVKTTRSNKKNLDTIIAKNRLKVQAFCNSAYASGLACLTDDEKEIGCTLIDIGEGSCDISMFKNGCFIYSFSIPMGGLNITTEIKSRLKCSMATAERLKILKGVASFNSSSVIEYKEDGSRFQSSNEISNDEFFNIIRHGIVNILQTCNSELNNNPFYKVSNNMIILTGGVSLTNGIKDLAESIFNKPVRVAKSQNCIGMPASYDNPTSVCSIGLVRYGIEIMTDSDVTLDKNKSQIMKKIVEWFKENL